MQRSRREELTQISWVGSSKLTLGIFGSSFSNNRGILPSYTARFFLLIGIKDHLTGQYIIHLPTYSRTVYYNGTKIAYIRNGYEYADSLEIDGPTNIPLRGVVSSKNTETYNDIQERRTCGV